MTDLTILKRCATALALGPMTAVSGPVSGQVQTNVPKEIHVPQTIEGAFARGAREMIYPGTQPSDVAVRFQEHVMPFFSRTLSFATARR